MEVVMTNTMKRFREIMTAATFAESGEWETARNFIPDVKLSHRQTWLDRIFSAITFAEYGLHSEAVSYLLPSKVKSKCTSSVTDDLGLKGVRLVYGTVMI
jgi:hypothetical protein